MLFRQVFKILLLLSTLILFHFSSLSAGVKFYNVNTIYGTSVREVFSIDKDTDGFVWASAKTGILRTTENDFRFYQLPHQTTDYVSVKLVHGSPQPTAYTNSGQIFRYDELRDRFFLLLNLRQQPSSKYITLKTIVANKEGILWMASSAGLLKYTGDSVEIVIPEKFGMDYIAPHNNHQLFCATFEGIVLLDTRTLEAHTICTSHTNDSKERFRVTSLYHDNKTNRLWIGTASHGLLYYEMTQKQLHNVTINNFPQQPIEVIKKNTDGTLFVGLDGQGIWNIDATGQKVLKIYRENPDDPYSLQGDGVHDIFCDSHKNWVATHTDGLSFFEKQAPSIRQIAYQTNNPYSPGDRHINKILEDCRGNIWFATNNGLSCWLVSTGEWKHYYQNKQANVFLALCEDGQGNIWAGSFASGIYILNGVSGKEISHHSSQKPITGFTGDFVLDIFKDSEGDIWIGGNQDLSCYLVKEQRFQSYPIQPVNSFAEFLPGELMLTTSYGLLSLHKQTAAIDTLIKGSLTQDIVIADSAIWIATGGDGLIKYNHHLRKTDKLIQESGLSSNYVNSIIQVGNHLWIGTENGLCKLNTTNNTIRTYSSIYTLSNTAFNVNACTQLKNGNLIWGTNDGAIIFHPDTVHGIHSQGKIFFQDISVSGHSIRKNPNWLQENIPMNKLKILSLPYNRNNFILELIPVGNAISGVKYSWKMEGIDTDWSQPTSLHFATYPNLPGGNYTLMIRMYNSSLSQIISERSLSVHIALPFWETWWFRLLIVLILTGLTIYSLKFYSNHLKQQYARDKIRFFTNIAHDIRTSLTLVGAPIEELNKATELSEQSRYYLKLATEQTEKLSLVANQLLDFQKVDTKHESLYLVMFDVVQLIRKRLLVFEVIAHKKGIIITFTSTNEHYVTAIDELKIERIIDNLLSNSIKYSYEGGQIDVTLDCTPRQWTLQIKDYGIGISDEAKTRLFREFYRGDNAVNFKIAGSGVGLLLVKYYTIMHGGQVFVESQTNKGSSFKITIPYSKTTNKHSPIEKHETAAFTEFSQFGDIISTDKEIVLKEDEKKEEKSSILIVEDNDDLRNFLQSSFQNRYIVQVAENGIEAWKAIKQHTPNLVISDIMMPYMDGFELCQQIKSTFETSHIPIILLTALSEKVQQLKGLGLGADDYIAKPFDLPILQKRIASILNNRILIREKALRFVQHPNDNDKVMFNNELNDLFVKKALTVVNNNLINNEFGKDEFAAAMNVSSSLLYKKIKALTGQSPSDFIKSIRMNHALQLLKSHQYTITEVSELSGFTSLSTFSRAFKSYFGKAPTDI